MGILILCALIIGVLLAIWFDIPGLFCTCILIFLSAAGVAFFDQICAFVQIHAFKIIGLTLLYFIIGGLWSLYQWYQFNVEVRDFYTKCLKNGGDSERAEVDTYLSLKAGIPPIPSQHGEQIIYWISMWPYCLLRWVLHDMIKEICTYIYNTLGGCYNRITQNIFKDLPK